MAKESGSNRSSTWDGNPYTVNGERKEYSDLPDDRKELIKELSKRVGDEMWANLKDKSVEQIADGEKINIEFDHSGIKHVARDALILLSGKYMSKNSMVNIDHILANSSYVPTKHTLSHNRSDNRQLWFKYKDNQGRGIYFSVAHSPKSQKKYTLYSVSDIPPKAD